MKTLLLSLVSLVLLAYPLLVFFGLQHFEARFIGVLVLGVLVGRLWLVRKSVNWHQLRALLPVTIAGVVLSVFIIFFNSPLLVKLNPVVVSFVMLGIFVMTLLKPPSMIERFARLSEPDLPPLAVIYTRQVTMAWCGFFLLNGLVAGYTVLYSSIEVWTLYNGLISYLLMGLLFVIEYSIRLKKKKDFEGMQNG